MFCLHPEISASKQAWPCEKNKKQNQAARKWLSHFNLLYLPVSPLCYPDRSATLSPPPCQIANFDADELPASPCPESSWQGCAALKSASASTGRPLQTWPAGGRMARCGSEAGEGWSWREAHFDSWGLRVESVGHWQGGSAGGWDWGMNSGGSWVCMWQGRSWRAVAGCLGLVWVSWLGACPPVPPGFPAGLGASTGSSWSSGCRSGSLSWLSSALWKQRQWFAITDMQIRSISPSKACIFFLLLMP